MNHVCFDLFRYFCWFAGLNWSKISKKKQFSPYITKIQSWCLNIVLIETFWWLSKVIYDGIWSAIVCFDLFRCLSLTPGDKIGHKQAKNSSFYSQKSDFVALMLCWDTKSAIFAYLRKFFASGVQDKNLNRSKYTLADQIQSYMALESH